MYMNPFITLHHPQCPKCIEKSNKCLTLCFSNISDDDWLHIKCANCNAPSFNGYYCEGKTKGKPHGIYSNPNLPPFSVDGKFYCAHCIDNIQEY